MISFYRMNPFFMDHPQNKASFHFALNMESNLNRISFMVECNFILGLI